VLKAFFLESWLTSARFAQGRGEKDPLSELYTELESLESIEEFLVVSEVLQLGLNSLEYPLKAELFSCC